MTKVDAESRALSRLSNPRAILGPLANGRGYGVYPTGDRRCRPTAILPTTRVRALVTSGALVGGAAEGVYVLAAAGAARLARVEAAPDKQFLAQHASIGTREVLEGGVARARMCVGAAGLARLARMTDTVGAPFLSEDELRAAQRLRSDWERGQTGLVRGSDWSAPPRGATPRGANTQERVMQAGCDARRRADDALAPLAPQLRRVIERAVLAEQGLEALERAEGWPARSAKIALKFALAQLALGYVARAASA